MKVQALIPSLYPRLLDRMIASARRHGAPGVDLEFLVIGPYRPPGDDIVYVAETDKPKGVYAASRLAIPYLRPDAVLHLTCDDVVYEPGWLARPISVALSSEARPIVAGVRHGGGLGTVYGRYYANFALVRVATVLRADIAPHFMPTYLTGQWGDAALALAVWRAGGSAMECGPHDGLSLRGVSISFADRMGYPEAKTKHAPFAADMAAIRREFGGDMGIGWPAVFRGFNIDLPFEALDAFGSNGDVRTICEPDYARFVEKRSNIGDRGRMEMLS